MTSIRHFPATHPLPDWRNLGVMLRLLLGANILSAVVALAQAPDLVSWVGRYVELAGLVEPMLLMTMATLALVRDALRRLPLRLAQAAVLGISAAMATFLMVLAMDMAFVDAGAIARVVVLAVAGSAILLGYFELRARAVSPAQAEARIAALNARIRPHFLFNSLNAVLSLIRARPQEAEAALESLSDLFRAAMRDPGERVRLADEIALGRQYLELERLRLGERLAVDWKIGPIPEDMPIPPLMLQPLLENAVYHGIEPRAEGGVVSIGVTRQGELLRISIANPVTAGSTGQTGNQLALDNIRERLALYYDLEARLEIDAGPERYEVRIALPCPK